MSDIDKLYNLVFSTPEGKKVLEDLLSRFHDKNLLGNGIDGMSIALNTHYLLGKKDLVAEIKRKAKGKIA